MNLSFVFPLWSLHAAAVLRFKIACTAAVLCTIGPLHAHAKGMSTPEMETDPSEHLIDLWTFDGELGQNAANAIRQDAIGYLWIGSRPEAYYAKLSSRENRSVFEVSKTDGVGKQDGASADFNHSPHVYQTWWFAWLALAAAFTLGFVCNRLRIRRLQDRERELERLVDERTGDLRREKVRIEQGERLIDEQSQKLRDLEQVRIRNLLRLRSQEKELKEVNDSLEEKLEEQFEKLVQERSRYEDELITAKEKAEASDRLKSIILNNLHHEFRTPLTAIMGFAQIIEIEGAEEVCEFAAEINRGGNRLLRTLDSLLHLSRIEADILDSSDEIVDLATVVCSVADRFRAAAEAKELDLTVEFPDGVDIELDVDRAALSEVVSSLIDNAVKFTSDGGVAVEAGLDDEAAYVCVSDTGVGIRPDFLPKIYEAFLQGSDGLSRSYEGCGLGLTVSKHLVDAFGGWIDLKTTPGEGSVFTVRFPVEHPKRRRASAA